MQAPRGSAGAWARMCACKHCTVLTRTCRHCVLLVCASLAHALPLALGVLACFIAHTLAEFPLFVPFAYRSTGAPDAWERPACWLLWAPWLATPALSHGGQSPQAQPDSEPADFMQYQDDSQDMGGPRGMQSPRQLRRLHHGPALRFGSFLVVPRVVPALHVKTHPSGTSNC